MTAIMWTNALSAILLPVIFLCLLPILTFRLIKLLGALLGSLFAPAVTAVFFLLPGWLRSVVCCIVLWYGYNSTVVLLGVRTWIWCIVVVIAFAGATFSSALFNRRWGVWSQFIGGYSQAMFIIWIFNADIMLTGYRLLDFAVKLLSISFVAYFLAGVARGLSEGEALAGQRRRDWKAGRILKAIQGGRPLRKDYILYLRPFMVTNRLAWPPPRSESYFEMVAKDWTREFENFGSANPEVAFEMVESIGISDMETVIAYALSPIAPLVALGQPGEIVGAGRIETEDALWEESFKVLAQHASAIIVIPSSCSGTLLEIRYIAGDRHCLRKTFFVMPEAMAVESDEGGDVIMYGYKEEWESARAALGAAINLPPYSRTAGIFLFNEDPPHFTPAPWDGPFAIRRTRKVFKELLTLVPPAPTASHGQDVVPSSPSGEMPLREPEASDS